MLITGILEKFKFSKFLQTHFNQNEFFFDPLSLVCHGLQENAFQVNQLFNVTWSNQQN
jgi:hypothetical protein